MRKILLYNINKIEGMKGVDDELQIWNIKIINNINVSFSTDSSYSCAGFQ